MQHWPLKIWEAVKKWFSHIPHGEDFLKDIQWIKKQFFDFFWKGENSHKNSIKFNKEMKKRIRKNLKKWKDFLWKWIVDTYEINENNIVIKFKDKDNYNEYTIIFDWNSMKVKKKDKNI